MNQTGPSLPIEFPVGSPARNETVTNLAVTGQAKINGLDVVGVVSGVAPGVYDGEPVNAVSAYVTLNPAGADNSIYVEAKVLGVAGNDFTVAITTPVQAAITTSVDGENVVVACGTKHRMVVTGTLDPNAAGTLIYAGQNEGYPIHPDFSTDGTNSIPESGNFIRLIPSGSGATTIWALEMYTDGVITGIWASSTAAAFPNGLTYVADDTETGTPVVTAALPTAAQTIAASENTLVTLAASGTVTGTIAAVTSTALAHGLDGTPAQLGRLATDGTKIWMALVEDLTVTQSSWTELTLVS